MPKLQYEQCLGCGSFVPFILDTTALYVAKCWWCGAKMTQVHGIHPRPRTPRRGTGRHAAPLGLETRPGGR